MFKNRVGFLVITVLLLINYSCQDDTINELEQAAQIIEKAQVVHGSELLRNSSFSFQFRKYEYQRYFEGEEEVAVRRTIKGEEDIQDESRENELRRRVDGKEIILSDSMQNVYKNSINSVFYFFTLPLKLNDDAVIAKYLGEESILGTNYHKIEVTFMEEGGGDDFEDIYVYWFHANDYSLDYFAYQYFTDGGGMRFRTAMNRRKIAGILVQDYVNYAPSENTSVYDLAKSYEAGRLQFISDIVKNNLQINTK